MMQGTENFDYILYKVMVTSPKIDRLDAPWHCTSHSPSSSSDLVHASAGDNEVKLKHQVLESLF